MKKPQIKISQAASLICLGGFLFAAVLAWLNITDFQKIIKSQTQQHLHTIAKSKAILLENMINDLHGDLIMLGENPQVKASLQKIDKPNKSNYISDYNPQRIFFEQYADKITSLNLIDSSGNTLKTWAKKNTPALLSKNQVDVQHVLNTQKSFIGSIRCCEDHKAFSICEPIRHNDKFIGLIRVVIDFEQFDKIVSDVQAGKNGYAWLMDNRGFIVSHPNKLFVGKSYEYILSSVFTDRNTLLAEIFENMQNGENGKKVYYFSNWQKDSNTTILKLVGYHPLNMGPAKWSIAICMDYNEIAGPVKAHARNVILTMGLFSCLLISAVAGHYFYERRKMEIRANSAITRVSEELLLTSDEKQQKTIELKKQDRLLNGIISNLPHAIYWKDYKGNYLGCNRRFAEFLNLKSPSEITEKNDHQLWNKDDAEYFKKYDLEIIKTGIPLLNIERTLTNLNGKKIRVVASKVPLIDNKKRVTGLLGIYTDITNYTKSWQGLLNNNPDHKDFFESLSFRLRTPLNSIIGFSELMTQEKLNTEQKEYVETILNNAKSIKDIFEQSLNNQGSNFESDSPVNNDKQVSRPENKNYQKPKHSDNTSKQTSDSETPDFEQPLEDPCKILLVDDVEENRILVQLVLKKIGHEVQQASNGKQALEYALQTPYDLILMDIQMPIMDGLAATEKIRKTEGPNQKTGIIAMTAMNNKGDELVCLDAGCDDYITKPLKTDLLLKKIERFIGQRKQIIAAKSGADILSSLINDEDYTKTVERFVDSLPDKIKDMQNALEQNNIEELSRQVHSLKGLGSFAGFPVYTEMARQIEKDISDNQMEKVSQQIDELVSLCSRTKIKS